MGAAGMMQGMAMKEDSAEARGAVADGTFSVTTDAPILANNTDEGPTASAAGKVLSWTINPRTPSAPTALLKLAP